MRLPWNSTVELPQDLFPVIPYSIAFAIVHAALKSFVFYPLADALSIQDPKKKGPKKHQRRPSSASPSIRDENDKKEDDDGLIEEKFAIAAWNCCCHTFLLIMGWYASQGTDWIWNPKSWFDHWPNHDMDPKLKQLFQLYTAYTVYSWYDLIRSIHQKDFPLMMLHHATTMFLLAFGTYYGFSRAGAFIMLLHDCSDPALELGKLSLYAGYEGLANVLFVVFALLFIGSRMFVFPATVIWNGWWYGPRYYPDGTKDVILMPLVMTALFALYCMHTYWSYLIVKMIVGAIKDGGVKGDVRDLDHHED